MLKVIFCLHHFFLKLWAGQKILYASTGPAFETIRDRTVVLIPGFDQSLTTEYAYEQIRVVKYAENSIEDRPIIMGNKKPDGLNEFERILILEKPDIIHFHELCPRQRDKYFSC
jgi:hypothetical protein